MIESIIQSVRNLELSNRRIETTLLQQEQTNAIILQTLQQLIQSNTLINQSNQQCVQSGPEKHMCDSPLSIGAIEMDCQLPEIFQNAETSTNGNENFMQVNQENYTAPLSYDSAFTTVGSNQISFGLVTKDELNPNGQSFVLLDDIEKSPLTIIQSIIHQTNCRCDSCIRREEHVTVSLTTIDRRSTEICLLNPLKEELSPKTDRITKLEDCFGQSPTLVVRGDDLPDNISMELAIISGSSTDRYHSVYQFSEKPGEHNDIIHREEIDTGIHSQKNLNHEYNLKYSQLAIRFFPENSSVPLQIDFLSNKLSPVSKEQYKPHVLNISIGSHCGKTVLFDPHNKCLMRLSVEIPEIFHCTLGTRWKWLEISIIVNNQLSPIYSIDLQDRVGDRNPNYYNIQEKSFDIPFEIVKKTSELIHNVNIYETLSTDQSEGPINNSNSNESFKNQNNSTLNIQVLNRFYIQIEFVHIGDSPNEPLQRYDKICSQWKSEEYKDFPHFEQTQTKQFDDEPCNYALGLPITIASIRTENDN
ncbi:unnamed protein product [Rotaria sp. Silwood2]|nr:unnamed protein product [Rotaria sp. Silwood2]CAF4047854.1 unnamed protein product [Rotaria sp. Silwood2]CAF4057961.1 unnamed protein product [Rotaria sp. Silwood2]CAF4132600.1 unnamed protein product [Rotaria sp. Silwood2]